MLDRVQLLNEIARVSTDLFTDNCQDFDVAHLAWNKLLDSPSLIQKIASFAPLVGLPTFTQQLDKAVPIDSLQKPYTAFSVDGSQIYPDRHMGITCYLINIGTISITYGSPSSFVCKTTPYIFCNQEDNHQIMSVDVVNGKRQELELVHGIHPAIKQQSDALLLFDGSLIFWHLEKKDTQLKELFFKSYLALLAELYQKRIVHASYISLPRSRELVNLLRWGLADGNPLLIDEINPLYAVTDATIGHFYLTAGHRSIVFKNNSSINQEYTALLATHFFYIHIGAEIGRVEIPAWIANDTALVDFVAAAIIDQCAKGHGYPLVLSEAHEQAVVKGADRDFFYHALQKLSCEQKRRIIPSQKSLKKRVMAV